MKKKHIICAGIAGIAGAVILGAGAFGITHVSIDGEFFPRNAAVYDLTGHELSGEQYQDICERFPDTQVLWTVPFQGTRYPMDTESITVTSLTEEEAQSLDQLPNLKLVDGTQCSDLSPLLYLQQRRPDCQVLYQVPIGGTSCSSLSQELTVTDANAAELETALPLLPQLRSLTLEGTLPAPEELLHLQAAFPSVEMHYTLDVWGQALSSDVQTIDLTAVPVTQEELERILPLFPNLEELILTDTDLTDAERKSLAGQFPDVFILCTMEFAGQSFSTDSTEIDISGHSISVEETEAMLPFFPRLSKLIMSGCGIDDEVMDALNRRHPEVSIVWTVQIGLASVRTDDTVFYPAIIDEVDLPDNEELKKLRYCTEMIAIDVGHAEATDCEWLEYTPHVKYLILADTQITDLTPVSNLKELIYLELFKLDLDDYSPLLGCTALQDLNISFTYADPEPLSQMTWLHNLHWNHGAENPDTRDAVLKLEEQLPDTNVVLDTWDSWRSIGGQWRYLPNYYVFREIIGGRFLNQYATYKYWGDEDSKKILACSKENGPFAGDVLAEIVRYRIDNDLPIVGIKNVGSEKAEILYQTLCDSRP